MADRPEACRGFFRPGVLRFRERVLRALDVLRLPEAQVLLILAVVVGIGAGLGDGLEPERLRLLQHDPHRFRFT